MNQVNSGYREAIDTHVHPIRSLISTDYIIKEMDKAKISKALLLALDLDSNYLDTNLSLKDEIIYDLLSYSLFINPYDLIEAMKNIMKVGNTSNELVAEMILKHPDKFIGFGSVNPSKNSRYVKKKLQEISDQEVFQGIKLIPTLQFFQPKKNKNLKTIFKFAKHKDWTILIHSGRDPGPWEIHTLRCVENTHPKFWSKIVKKFSKNKIIFAHLGGYGVNFTYDDTWFEEVLQMATKYPHIYLDTSAVTYHLENRKIVNRIRETCGFKRVLFGTDTPVVMGTSMGHSKFIIENNPLLNKEEKKMILSENAKQMFQIE
ncbi:MAG: amidohydrolase family protein [Candidatus Hodarchaeales archaeon]|jgi:predicted TIM-barrel fold metal-dependent hydrolase